MLLKKEIIVRMVDIARYGPIPEKAKDPSVARRFKITKSLWGKYVKDMENFDTLRELVLEERVLINNEVVSESDEND